MSESTTTERPDDPLTIQLPPSLQPGYREPLPPQFDGPTMSPSQLPPELGGTVVPSGQIPGARGPAGQNYTVTGTGPGTWWQQQHSPPNRPPDEYQRGQPLWHLRPGEPGYEPQQRPWDQPQLKPALEQMQPKPPQVAGINPGTMVQPQPQAPVNPDAARQRFIDTYGPLAVKAGEQLGVDPRLILGQWAMESAWGTSRVASTGNMAGIRSNGQYDAYQTPQQFADAYVERLRLPRYQGAIGAGSNADQFFGGLKRGGYFEADLGQYKNLVGQHIGGFGNQVPAQQRYVPSEVRGSEDWGHPSPVMGGRGPTGEPRPGEMPKQSDFGRIMSGIAPLLLGIASIALRLPLSTAITAYGAMSRAQQNGQELEEKRNRTRHQDALKESTAQQIQESRDASDAFSEYGHNNPEGLQQALMQVALKHNDPIMYRMAERGDLNGIYQMQQKRDAYNQDLTKLHKAQDDEEDRRSQRDAVKAMDEKWLQEHPGASKADFDIAHNEHVGQAAHAGSKDPKVAGEEQEGQPLDVIGADGKPTGQQVRAGKHGGYYDPNTKQPVQLKPGEKTQPVRSGAGAGSGTAEGMTPYDVIGKDGKPTGRQVRMGKNGGLFDLGSPPQPVELAEGETVRPVSRQVPPQAAVNAPDTWEGAPFAPPPGVDAGLWQQARSWAEHGHPPLGLGGRASSMYQAVEPLVPAAMKSMGITSLAQQEIKYEAQKRRALAIETAFGSGMLGRNVVALNTVADHIGLFRQYAEALKTGDTQVINRAVNALSAQAGSAEIVNFALAKTMVGDEVVRVLTTSGGTITDREHMAANLAPYSSEEQLTGAADTLTNFVRSRFDGLRQQYARSDPAREREFNATMLTPEARRLFEGPQLPVQGAPNRPAQSTGDVPVMTEEQYNGATSGTRYRMPNDPPGTFRTKP